MAMQAAHDGFWEWNPISKQLKVGPRLLQILGYAEDFLPDTHAWLRIVHPDDVATYNQAVSQHLKGQSEYFYCEYRVLASDGCYHWIASRGLAVRDRKGRAFQMVGSVTDITDRRHHQEELEFLAQHDLLTGLPNRLLFAEQLGAALRAASHSGQSLAVLFIDLDRFKNINDTLGHRAGDSLLQILAKQLKAGLPAHCRLYRQGGDEFIILAEQLASSSHASELAQKIRQLISAPLAGGTNDFFTSASIGISLYPDDASDGDTLLRQADTAMYEAKAAGGNAVRLHTSLMDQRVNRRVLLESRLRQAIDKQQLSLHFQPQMNCQSGHLVGAEALLRWHDGERIIPPDEFIPVAEETGLIIPIGEWVIRQAIAQIASWRAHYGDIPTIAVNLSPRQFWRPGLADFIITRLHEAALPASALEIEITESVILDAEEGRVEELIKIQAAGIAIALDDFGTGYSSLAYLQRLPISTLKIDRSFIRNLPEDGANGSAVLVNAIIAMAHSLGLQVVAEGVETPTQLAVLEQLGCEVIQGYFYGRPMPADDFALNFLVDRTP